MEEDLSAPWLPVSSRKLDFTTEADSDDETLSHDLESGDSEGGGTDAASSRSARECEVDLIVSNASKDLASLVRMIERSGTTRVSFKNVAKQAAKRQHWGCTRKRHIKVVGASSAGKSTLINALLGLLNAARTSAGAEACTQVPNRYQSPFSGQIKVCAAFIVLRTRKEIVERLRRLLQDVIFWHNADDEEFGPEELDQFRAAAHTAIEAFRMLFCDREHFETTDAAIEFLVNAAKEKTEDENVSYLYTLFEQLWKDVTRQDTFTDKHIDSETQTEYAYFEADDMRSIHTQIERYAYLPGNYEYNEPLLWPMVNMVHFGLKNVPVLKYTTVTDWPGHRDTNRLRADAAADSGNEGDEIWIVADAVRICSDPTAFMYLDHFGWNKRCVVVLTQIDLKWTDEDVKKFGTPAEIDHYQQLESRTSEILGEVEQLKNEIAKRREIRQTGYYDSKGPERRKLFGREWEENLSILSKCRDEEDMKNVELDRAEYEAFAYGIEVRKNYLSRHFKKQVEKHARLANRPGAPERSLKYELSPVSSDHYLVSSGQKRKKGDILALTDTGIPLLKSFVTREATKMVLEELQHHINHRVPRIYKGIREALDPRGLQGCEDAISMLREKETRVGKLEEVYHQAVSRIAKQKFITDMAPLNGGFAQLAVQALNLKRDKSWYAATIRAFVNNDGHHRTSSKAEESWNQQFLEGAVVDYLTKLEEFKSEEELAFNQFQHAIVGEVRDTVSKMDDSTAGCRLPKDRFGEFVDNQIGGITYKCKLARADFRGGQGGGGDLSTIESRATEARNTDPAGYFNRAMTDAYTQCRRKKGKGYKTKVLDALETYLTLAGDGSPYAVASDFMVKDLESYTKQSSAQVRNEGLRILEVMKGWLEDMLKPTPEEKRESDVSNDLRNFLAKAEPSLEELQKKLLEMKRALENSEERKGVEISI